MLFFDTKELLSKIKVLPLLKETNFDMTKKRFMKLVTIDAAMSFQEKEACIVRGLLPYIGDSLGEYLTVDQVVSLAQTLRRLRNRPAEVEFSEDLCSLVSEDAEIRNRYIPRKMLLMLCLEEGMLPSLQRWPFRTSSLQQPPSALPLRSSARYRDRR